MQDDVLIISRLTVLYRRLKNRLVCSLDLKYHFLKKKIWELLKTDLTLTKMLNVVSELFILKGKKILIWLNIWCNELKYLYMLQYICTLWSTTSWLQGIGAHALLVSSHLSIWGWRAITLQLSMDRPHRRMYN